MENIKHIDSKRIVINTVSLLEKYMSVICLKKVSNSLNITQSLTHTLHIHIYIYWWQKVDFESNLYVNFSYKKSLPNSKYLECDFIWMWKNLEKRVGNGKRERLLREVTPPQVAMRYQCSNQIFHTYPWIF